MTRAALPIVVLVVVSLLALPVAAHHSFSAEFDSDRPVRLEGRNANVEWTNPHALISIDVVDGATNRTIRWTVELAPPNAMVLRGLNRADMPPGADILVEGFLARSGEARVGSTSVTLKGSGRRFAMPTGNFGMAPPEQSK
jgi:hypothetical protein